MSLSRSYTTKQPPWLPGPQDREIRSSRGCWRLSMLIPRPPHLASSSPATIHCLLLSGRAQGLSVSRPLLLPFDLPVIPRYTHTFSFRPKSLPLFQDPHIGRVSHGACRARVRAPTTLPTASPTLRARVRVQVSPTVGDPSSGMRLLLPNSGIW